MAKKKIPIEDSSEPSEDPVVVKKVDKMMDPGQPEPEAEPAEPPNDDAASGPSDGPPPLDIFADTPGAPPLAKKTKKGAKRAKTDPQPEEPGPPAAETDEPAEPGEASEQDEPEPINPDQPENYDDPGTAKAIEDIVAHESDAVLSIQDQKLAAAQEENTGASDSRHTHRLFWALIAIICLIAIGAAVVIIDPSIHNPLSKLHWQSIRRRL